jgi:hypothetical protein
MLPYSAFALGLLLVLRKSALWLWQIDAWAFCVATLGFAIFYVGAVGLELLGYYLVLGSTSLETTRILEEWLEMFGVSLILYATLHLKLTFETPAAHSNSAAPVLYSEPVISSRSGYSNRSLGA